MPAAMRPGLTFLLAVLNSSLVFVLKLVYLFENSSQYPGTGFGRTRPKYLKHRDADHGKCEEGADPHDNSVANPLR
jgi:hypothetical protein